MDTLPTWARRRRHYSNTSSRRRRRQSKAGLAVRLPLSASPFLFVLCILLTWAQLADAIWFLPEKRFRYQGLIDAGALGLTDVGSGIAAWGDWDGDQYLDAFLLSADHKTIELRLWDHTEFTYSPKPLFSISPQSGDAIVNAMPSDFNRDGRLDLLLMTQSARGAPIQMEIWLGKGREGGGVESAPISAPSSTSAQTVLLDGTGDMRMDLLGHSSQGGELVMWENIFSTSNSSQAFQVVSAPLRNSVGQEQPCTLADPHSSAFVDLNGDCMADLFLVCAPAYGSRRNRYQIWTATQDATASKNKGKTNAPPGGFVFSRSGELPEGAGPLSFADMNRDGTIDVVFASCNSSDCYINVAYNKQIDLCDKKVTATGNVDTPKSWKDWWWGDGGREGGGGTERCRETERLCVADDSFDFDFQGKQGKDSLLQVPFSTLLPGHIPLMEDKLAATPSAQPIPLVVGDFNKDGYPDVLLLTVPPKAPSDGTGKTAVNILRNQRCSRLSSNKAKQQCQKASSADEEARWFSVVEDGADVLRAMTDVRSAAWVDLDDDGSLDVVLQRGSKKDGGARSVTFVQNNYFYDAFFLKSLTLNGACASTCEAKDARTGVTTKYKPWGASLPGASYKFTVLDTNGNRRAQQVGQLAQSSYRPLLTPYSYFGLGRTNNYVEKLFVGSTLQSDGYYLSMEGVIPNSQVVISPYYAASQPDSTAEEPAWHRELYLQPGDWIPWVTLVLVTLILALCGFVFAMHLNEKREDERERKRAVHAINFDALG